MMSIKLRRTAVAMVAPRRYIIVAPANVATGIGDALRKAFSGPEMCRTVQMFERLIERLDRPER
jgi:hypothetical protein